MAEITTIVAPNSHQIRLLTTINDTEVLKAALPHYPEMDLRALPRILEGLALWTQRRVSVVLVADEAAGSSCGAIFEALDVTSTLHYEVGVAVKERRSRTRQTIGGVANFRDLQVFRRRTL